MAALILYVCLTFSVATPFILTFLTESVVPGTVQKEPLLHLKGIITQQLATTNTMILFFPIFSFFQYLFMRLLVLMNQIRGFHILFLFFDSQICLCFLGYLETRK